jgi:hypothetical protein
MQNNSNLSRFKQSAQADKKPAPQTLTLLLHFCMARYIMSIQSNKQGSLLKQAERKVHPSTLLPDADNAAVGSTDVD